jgi:hypothetical protein
MASELLVSKMENFRNFVFTHPVMELILPEMNLMQRVKFESLKTVKLSSNTIMGLYKEFLVEIEKEKEKSPFHLTLEGWIFWGEEKEFDVAFEASRLAKIRPEKTAEEWENVLINDQNKLLAYLNLVHEFYLRINSAS